MSVPKDTEFIYQHDRFKSTSNTVITVKCGSKLKCIKLCDINLGIREFTADEPQQETANSSSVGGV